VGCGVQPVREAIRTHGARLGKVVVVETTRDDASPQLEALARFARDQGAPVERLARADVDRMARGVRHQGAIAFAPELRVTSLADLELADKALLVAPDEIGR